MILENVDWKRVLVDEGLTDTEAEITGDNIAGGYRRVIVHWLSPSVGVLVTQADPL